MSSRWTLLFAAVAFARASPAMAQRGGGQAAPRPAFNGTPHDVLRAYGYGANAGLHTGGPLTPRTGVSITPGGITAAPTSYPVFNAAPNTWFPSRTTGFSTSPLFPYSSFAFPYGYGFAAREENEETQRKPLRPEWSVAPDPTSATMDVQVPADAEIWFQGAKTGQQGPTRTFVSPPLEPGQNFTYDIRARWSDGGKEMDQTRQVRVKAGEHVQVDFGVKK
jgi:uncharacterized protein (TIGR03000 family)